MARARLSAVAAIAVALGGCSMESEALWPSLSSGPPAAAATARPAAVAQAPLPATRVPTTTIVGQRVAELRGNLQRLQEDMQRQRGEFETLRRDIGARSQAYYGTVGAINSRLMVGTTPGNPELLAQWDGAQNALVTIDGDVARMNQLATRVAASASLAAYMLETIRSTYTLSGAVEEDHRQLGVLQDEANRLVVQIERLMRELSDDVARQTNYLGNERANLTTLSVGIKNGSLVGNSIIGRSFGPGPAAAPGPQSSLPVSPAAAEATSRRPLVVIRFDRANVSYEEPLYTAVSRAIERRPSAEFDLVAVTPGRGSPAQVSLNTDASKRNAESVLRSLADMGLPLDRVRLSAMTSTGADSNEVHVYVR
ncbi:MAG: hypothetical protein AB7K86_25045 [Rhodospirillales bacterium]